MDRAHAVAAGANELIPVFDSAIREIVAATGLEFPHACRKELLAAIDKARLPFTRENIRLSFFKIWGRDAQGAMTPEERSTRQIEQDAKSLSADDFAIKYGASSRGRW